MKQKKFKTHPIKNKRLSIYTRIKLRRAWYIAAPLLLVTLNITASILMQNEMKDVRKAIQRDIELANMEEVVDNETLLQQHNTSTEVDGTIMYHETIANNNDSRLTFMGGGLSSITETTANKLKKGITYSDLNKYNRPGVITAVIDNTYIQPDATFGTTIENTILTLNMLPKSLGGETKPENNICMINDIYNTIYAPIMKDIYEYIRDSGMTVVIKITPTWSNVQYQMPDTIRIDVYSLDDYGQSVNRNYIIANKKMDGQTDYRNLDNN